MRSKSIRELVLLGLGVTVGVGLGAWGLSSGTLEMTMPTDAVALVNDAIITARALEQAVAAAAQTSATNAGDALREEVLERMIDEELLVQRGLELGLAREDRKIRAELVSAVLASIVTEAQGIKPDEAAVLAYFEKNRERFVQRGQVHVRQVFCRNTGDSEAALQCAQDAARRLRAGEDISAVRRSLGDHGISVLPDRLISPSTLRQYLGPALEQTALSMEAGEVSEPIVSTAGYHVLHMVERQPDFHPSLEQVRLQVEAEVRRAAGEEAVREYLARLRSRARIEKTRRD